MKFLNVLAFAFVTLNSVNALAGSTTDEMVIRQAAARIQEVLKTTAVMVDYTDICQRSIRLHRDWFTDRLAEKHMGGFLMNSGAGGSPEGNGSVTNFYEGSVLVPAAESYLNQEEYNAKTFTPSAIKMVLGMNLKIIRSDCKAGDVTAELELYSNKDNNVVSKTEFKLK